MARRIGLVTAVLKDETAEVITDRKGGCGGCEQSHGCRSCLSGAKVVSTVKNPVGAEPGDVVVIDITNKGLWTGALLFYILPILFLIFGTIMGEYFGRLWFSTGTSTLIVSAMLGFGIGLSITILISRSRHGNLFLRPKIVHVVERMGNKSSDEMPTLKPTAGAPD